MAYNKQGTHLWMYRWHQTWWYLSELDWKFADSEDDFTKPVLYSSMVAEPIDFPPAQGWTFDKMLHGERVPAPTVQHSSCEVMPDGTTTMWPCPAGAELPCAAGSYSAAEGASNCTACPAERPRALNVPNGNDREALGILVYMFTTFLQGST